LTKKTVAALVLVLLIPCAGRASAESENAASQGHLFQWEMPSRFGTRRDEQGRIAETQPYEVRRGPWRVLLSVANRACRPSTSYHWKINGNATAPKRLGRCRFALRVPREGSYEVGLETGLGKSAARETQRVDVQDWLIVSIGDSVASGEGVPEDAGWQSARCHRSALAGPALAARQIEEDDPHSSVTFVHLACSGAEVPRGLTGPYAGALPPEDEPLLPPQVEELNRIALRRPVDAVLLSIGANDIHFSEFLFFCAKHPFGDCFTHTYSGEGGNGEKSAGAVAEDLLADLPRRYDELADSISKRIPPRRIHIVEYFDPTRDAEGRPCRRLILDIFRSNVERAETLLLEPLNRAVAAAAEKHSWDEVRGVAELFRGHGICAGKQAWVSSLPDSLLKLSGWAGRHRGAMHPNERGHEETSRLIAQSLERDLYGNSGHPGPGPHKPGPAHGGLGSSGSGTDLGDALLTLAKLLLLATAILLATFALGLWVPIGLLIWLAWSIGAPILVGLLLAVLVLLRARNLRHLLRPFVALLRTLRPLLLPLVVIFAVGTVKWSPLAQVLVTAALVLLAWRLIVVPEAGKAGVNLAFEQTLLKKVLKHGLVAVATGAAAVFLLRELVLPSSAYFHTIGDAASALLLLGVLLWTVAIALRLVSHATSRLRAVVALLVGLCLLIPAMALGLLPWGGDLESPWPSLLVFFGACALLVMLIEAARGLIVDPSPQTEALEEQDPPTTFTGRVRGLGFSAAAAAAVVLAISTGWGMVDAADNGKPLNPPEEDSAEAAVLPAGATPSEDGLEIAKRYAPVLVFTRKERWTPVPVGPYVARAKLSGPAGTPAKLNSYKGLDKCPRGQSWCYTLSIGCEEGSLKCSGRRDLEATDRSRKTLHREGAVYVRVADRGQLPPAERQAVFGDGGPFGQRWQELVQYWYWYEYDEWEAPVFAGLLTQRHEGDWEAVTLGLDDARRPLFLAYSAHCAGSWRPWGDVEVSTLPGGRVHPLVAVAEGSHANYPAAEQERAPDWASCAGLAPAGVTTAISFASNIRDRTEYAWPWYPADDGWIPVHANTPPMSFKGSWGKDDRATLTNFKVNSLGAPGHGPLSPPLQALWREPAALIFCGKYTPRECGGG